MILSNRMTANNLELKPAIQHISNTEKTIRDEMPRYDYPVFLFADVSLIAKSYTVQSYSECLIN
jgi:hypothetical protein